MHCFDADKIKGGKIVVKTCKVCFISLMSVERKANFKSILFFSYEDLKLLAAQVKAREKVSEEA